MFSAFAFVVAAGLSLDGSPFRERTAAMGDARPSCESSCATRAFDPALAGVYDTTWGVIALDADGSARGSTDQAGERDVVGRWHVTHEAATMIHFEWATGSYAAALEWWRPSGRFAR